VHAAASRQVYGLPGVLLPRHQNQRGVAIHRLWTTNFGRHYLLGRALDYVTFYVSVLLWLLRFTRSQDLLIVATDPPLLSVVVWVATTFSRASRINWLHDLYPEVASALGIPTSRIGYRLLLWLRDRSLASAAMNVAIGQKMAEYLKRRAIPSEQIAVIHNWADGTNIRPITPESNLLRERWGLSSKFVLGYSGNLGRAHDFETVLRAAQTLQDTPDIMFLFIGTGHYLSWIRSQVDQLELPNVLIKPHQPDELLDQCLGVPDVHLVSLRPEFEGLIVPSKFYGVIAAGRPTLYIGDLTGEVAAVLSAADCGSSLPPGDVDGLVRWALHLRDCPEQRARWCRNARELFLRRFDRSHAIGRWWSLLGRIATKESASSHLLADTGD
jgi:glycosyltransferase involved in cell wall biosynthesis